MAEKRFVAMGRIERGTSAWLMWDDTAFKEGRGCLMRPMAHQASADAAGGSSACLTGAAAWAGSSLSQTDHAVTMEE